MKCFLNENVSEICKVFITQQGPCLNSITVFIYIGIFICIILVCFYKEFVDGLLLVFYVTPVFSLLEMPFSDRSIILARRKYFDDFRVLFGKNSVTRFKHRLSVSLLELVLLKNGVP